MYVWYVSNGQQNGIEMDVVNINHTQSLLKWHLIPTLQLGEFELGPTK